MKKLFTFILLSLFSFINLYSQQESVSPCGTEDSFQNDHWLNEIQQDPNSFRGLRSNTDTLYLPLSIHIIGTDEGNGYFGEQNLFRALCDLNDKFEPVGMVFYIKGDVQYHNNTTWYEHESGQVGNAMYQATRVPNTINCYIDNNANGACGYAFIGGDRMYLRKSCIGANSSTWAHEMGHSLTLGHTFRGWERETVNGNAPAPEFVNSREVEKVDRSNCTFSGDGFCDTEPDYLSSRWTCNANGESSLQMMDPDSVRFRAQGRYIMGYASDICMSIFSEEQTTAMRVHALSQKANMVTFEDPFTNKLSAPFTELLTPLTDQIIDTEEVEFTWEPIENAEGYQIQVTRFVSFSIILHDTIVETNSITLSGFDNNRNYYFRVKPVSSTSYCQYFEEQRRFRMELLQSSVNEIAGASFQVSPTLLRSGQNINLDIVLDRNLDAQVSILSLDGKIIFSSSLSLTSGTYRKSISTNQLTSSMYMLQIRSSREVYTSKFLIH